MIKTGIVVEGGVMRGMYGVGVLDVLLEKNIYADGLIGVSVGAIHGCSFVSEQKGRSIRYNLKYCRDPRYMSFQSLIRTGDIFGKDFCYHKLPEKLGPFDNDIFEASATRYYVTCTDVETGQPVYHYCPSLRGELIDWVRASTLMSLASRMAELDDRKLLDGGASGSIPVGAFRKVGYKRTLVILTWPAGYWKKQNPMMPVIRRAFREYPEFMEAARRRHPVYNRELDEIQRLEREGQVYVICPSYLIKIWRTERDLERIRQVYELRRKGALGVFPEIKIFTVR